MVPKKVGDELRRRRLFLDLRQVDVAHALGINPSTGRDYTRSYVSQVEHGVAYDPDADGLVRWAQALGWDENHILRTLGRAVMSTTPSTILTADLLKAIKQVVAEAVREELDRPRGGGNGPAPGSKGTRPDD
jgi:transcriptional regulator with XRE-family HTH domain